MQQQVGDGIVRTIALGSSLVVYDAILCRIASPDDRDEVSSRGWALGYLGGGLLLALNLVIVSAPDLIGVDKGTVVEALAVAPKPSAR